jgi:AraC family transcriptional regulator
VVGGKLQGSSPLPADRVSATGTNASREPDVATVEVVGLRPSTSPDSDPDRILFSTRLVAVGQFRCRVDHALFHDSGPIRQPCFVFPRTAVTIAHDGRRPFVADATVVTLYNAGQRYERTAISPEGDRCDWFGVAPALLRDAVRSFDRSAADEPIKILRHRHAPSRASLYWRQRQLFRTIRDEALKDSLEVEETVCSLLHEVVASAYHGEPAGETDRRTRSTDAQTLNGRGRLALAEDTRRFIARHFSETFSLNDLAAHQGCSPFHLCRVFGQATGRTIHVYRDTLRLRASLERVEEGLSLTAVALDLGYSSHSHFTERFRRAFGVPPSRTAARTRLARIR